MDKKTKLHPVYSISLHIRTNGVTIRAGFYNRNFLFSDENSKRDNKKTRISREDLGELARTQRKYERVGDTRYLCEGIILPSVDCQKLERVLRKYAPILEKNGTLYLNRTKIK